MAEQRFEPESSKSNSRTPKPCWPYELFHFSDCSSVKNQKGPNPVALLHEPYSTNVMVALFGQDYFCIQNLRLQLGYAGEVLYWWSPRLGASQQPTTEALLAMEITSQSVVPRLCVMQGARHMCRFQRGPEHLDREDLPALLILLHLPHHSG